MLKVTPHGNNSKLGPGVETTYRPVGITCPGDRWVSCGDPWPCTTPPKKQLIAAALYARNPDDQDAQDALVSAFATKKKTGARA